MEKARKKKVRIRFKNKKMAIMAVAIAAVALVVICLAIWGIVSLATKNNNDVERSLHSDFSLTALSGSMDSVPNTLSYIKNAAMSGANIVEVDLMFNSDGEPVLTDNFDDIDNDSTVPLSKAFETLREFPEISIMLDLHALTNLPRVEELAEKYNMFNRIYYSGVTIANAEYVSSKSPNIQKIIDIDLSVDSPDDNIEYYDYVRDNSYDSYAISVDIDHFTDIWSEMLLLDGHRVSVYNVSSEKDFKKALDLKAANVVTDKPGEFQAYALDWLVGAE